MLLLNGLGVLGGEPKLTGPPPGTVAVPLAAVPIRAYEDVRIEHLLRPEDGSPAVLYVPADTVLPGVIRDPREVVGRVMAHAKRPGDLFTEADFLPAGTRPGIAGGIPPGRRGMRVDVARVAGLVGLSPGDRFDLVATTGPAGGSRAPAGAAPPSGVGAGAARTLVEDGVVVSEIETRNAPRAGGGPSVVQEIVIAIQPSEVGSLTSALAGGGSIAAVPRSGRPDDVNAPAPAPRDAGPRVVETITGTTRGSVTVPGRPDAGASPPRER